MPAKAGQAVPEQLKGLHVYHMISSATKISFRNSVLFLFTLCGGRHGPRRRYRLATGARAAAVDRPQFQTCLVLIYSLNYLWRHFYGVGTRRLTGWHSSFADCFSSSCTYYDVRQLLKGLFTNAKKSPRFDSFYQSLHTIFSGDRYGPRLIKELKKFSPENFYTAQ